MRKQSEEDKKAKQAERSKRWYEKNKELTRQRAHDWYHSNKEQALETRATWQQANRDKHRASNKKYYKNNTKTLLKKSKEKSLKYNYGITLEERNKMLEDQGFKCAICSSSDPGFKDWYVDHCHRTENVRGLLCHHCNCMLGFARDNPATLLGAVEYLRKHSNGDSG